MKNGDYEEESQNSQTEIKLKRVIQEKLSEAKENMNLHFGGAYWENWPRTNNSNIYSSEIIRLQRERKNPEVLRQKDKIDHKCKSFRMTSNFSIKNM